MSGQRLLAAGDGLPAAVAGWQPHTPTVSPVDRAWTSIDDEPGPLARKPLLSIEYCTLCNFRGRAAWLAQELLAALEQELAGVTLVPGTGGVFDVRLDGDLVFSEKKAGRFPEPREMKDLLRAKLGLAPDQRHGRRST